VTLLVLERSFDPSLDKQNVIDMAIAGGWCFQQHRVDWLGSMLSADGRSMVCQFTSGDAESIRLALGMLNTDLSVLWPATVHDAPETTSQPNVIVERTFDSPCNLDELQSQEDSNQWCLETHNVKFVRTLFSRDRKRMLCLYRGPDAEAVRNAQQQAGMPVDRVWAFTQVGMADLST